MPFASDSQRKFFNANRGKLEKQGVDVDEWNHASKGMKLPEHVHHEHSETPYSLAHKARKESNG